MKPMKTISQNMIQKIKMPARRRAFTLIELLIVISIIGLLAAFVPYLVMRGLAARAARRWRRGESAGQTR